MGSAVVLRASPASTSTTSMRWASRSSRAVASVRVTSRGIVTLPSLNTGFVANVLGGQSAIGRRIRYLPWGDGEPGPWLEIVGVVGSLGMRVVSPTQDQGVYQPFAPGDLGSVQLGIHVGGDPVSFTPRLRAIAAEVDPTAVVTTGGVLSDVFEGDWYLMRALGWGGGLLVAILLALAASGIYAMMSFAVTERTTEIGIRSALGARRRDVASSIGLRAMGQLVAGVVLGMPLAGVFYGGNADSALAGMVGAFLFGVAVIATVGLVACTGPTLRALRITPSEALRGKG